jgi:hypothetical protein
MKPQTIKKISLTITLILFLCCGNRNTSQNTIINTEKENNDIYQFNKPQFFNNSEFEEFYTEFISDSMFQKKHLAFPLGGAVFECDAEILHTKDNWIFFDDDIRNFNKEIDSIEMHQDVNKYELILIRKEIGTIYDIVFEKKCDSWFLTYCLINAC